MFYYVCLVFVIMWIWITVKSSILDKESVSRVVSLLMEAEAAAEDTPASTSGSGAALRVIDAFVVPKYRYDPIKKMFLEYVPFFSFISFCRVD